MEIFEQADRQKIINRRSAHPSSRMPIEERATTLKGFGDNDNSRI